ncbi:MAG: hypothetical protein HFJ08_11675 [Lachnospiraceae bacterium]|nr:hypothetical protein [Lachnospiraceae bacterium]
MHGNLKKLLAGLLSAVMVFTSVPVSARVAETVGVTDENQTETVEASEENSGEERSSISDNARTGEEKESSSSFLTEEQVSEVEESSVSETGQTESQTVTESLTEDKTDTSKDSEKITQTETVVESTILEESTEEVTQDYKTEAETEGTIQDYETEAETEETTQDYETEAETEETTQDYETEAETEEETAEDGLALNASGSGVAEKLNSLRNIYPNGQLWTGSYPQGQYYQCWGFANLIFDSVFGQLPDWQNGRRTDKDGIKVGDYVRFGDDGWNGHSFIVLEKGSGHNVRVVECNYSNKDTIEWGRWQNLDGYFYYNGSNRYFSYYCRATNYDQVDNPTPPVDRQKGSYMNTGYSQVIPNGYYHIVSSFGDQWWLTIAGMSNDDGANVQLYDYSSRGFECDEQLFYFQFIDEGGGKGFYKITNKQSGKCLNVASDYLFDESGTPTNIDQRIDNGSSAQQWAIRAVDGGDKGILYTLQARCSGYCLDLWGANTENGTNISMYTDNATAAQQWRLVPYAPSVGQTIPDGEYQIVYSTAENKAIGAVGNTCGANVELSSLYKGDYRYTFEVKYLGNGYYSIINKYSGLSLDVAGVCRTLGTNVWLWDCVDYDAQKWIIQPCGNGCYNIISKCNGLYLNLEGGDTKDGNNISMWSWNVGSTSQKWKFVPYEQPKFAQPTASIPSGTEVEKGTKLILICLGADHIYYTTDGTQPTRNSAEYPLQTGIIINTDMTVKTFAVKEGYQDSDVAEFTYTVKQNAPGESENPSDEESSTTEESGTIGDDDIEDGVKWHYNESKVTYKDLSQSGARITTNIKSKVYDGSPYKPVIKVTAVENGKTIALTEGADYRLEYSNNIHAGIGCVTVKGNGFYKGEISKNFEITKKSCNKWKVVTGGMIVGDTSEPKVYVYDGNKLLTKGKDYVLEGIGRELTATKGSKKIYIVAAPLSDYKDSITASLMVYAKGSHVKGVIDNPAMIKLSQSTYEYTGKACKPTVVVTVDGYTLKVNKDYSIKYKNNTNVGTASVTVCGKGAYVGSIIKEFTIASPSTNNGFALKKPIKDVVYNGKLQKPKIAVLSNGRTLKLNRDYTISYNNNLHATNNARIIVRGKGNYASMPTKVFQFKITPRNINKVSVKGKQGSLVLTYAKHRLVEGVDYDIIYGEPVGKGKISVTIKAKDGSSFTGEITKKVLRL